MILRMEYARERKPQLTIYGSERAETLEEEVLSAFMRVHRELYPPNSENKSATEEDILFSGTDPSARLYFYRIGIDPLERWFKRIKSGVILEMGAIESENAIKYLDGIVNILRAKNKEAKFQEYYFC